MIIDLTMSIDMETPVFPGDPKQKIEQIATIEKDGWNEKRLTFNSHFSTHIDAPLHMIKGGKSLSDYPMEKFIGEAVVFDVRGKSEIEIDLSEVNKGNIIFFFTGHGEKAYNEGYFKNNPIITEKMAKEMVDKKIKIVGLDSFTPDNKPYSVHKLFFRNDILIVENLMNLEKLAGKRSQCYILPLKIKDADGAPCRVVCIVD